MKFDVITIFPKIFDSYLNESILKRALKKGIIEIKIRNPRDFCADKHNKADDRPFGGGPGMVLKAEPIVKAVASILKSRIKSEKSKTKIILFSPAGKRFNDKIAVQLAKNYNRLILICGRYEGIDERVKEVIKDLGFKIEEWSIGDYVLTGGELPAMVLIDSVSRRITGVLGKRESLEEKRLGVGVPAFTRPEEMIYNKKKYRVPTILLSGNHKKVEEWRKKRRKTK